MKLLYGWGIVSFSFISIMALGLYIGQLDSKYRSKTLSTIALSIVLVITVIMFIIN